MTYDFQLLSLESGPEILYVPIGSLPGLPGLPGLPLRGSKAIDARLEIGNLRVLPVDGGAEVVELLILELDSLGDGVDLHVLLSSYAGAGIGEISGEYGVGLGHSDVLLALLNKGLGLGPAQLLEGERCRHVAGCRDSPVGSIS